jgi:signal transduction histidine kinase
MEKLIEEMLLLARSDQRQETPAAQPQQEVDLSDLTENALLFFEPVLYEAGLRLEEEEIAPGVAVAGDSAALGRLAEILLDNAVKYTPKGGGIRVSLTESGKKAVLRVANQGKPIPEEERERIFRRFYRSDAARSSKGFGLGLAIAREIAQEHGGTLDAASTPEGYNVFQCVLPLAN